MPMHDWTKVEDVVYHDFHTSWIVECARAINRRLPKGYCDLKEKSLGMLIADVIAMRDRGAFPSDSGQGSTAMLAKPRTFQATDQISYSPGFRQRRIAIRHELLERVVAIVELVSPGNKASEEKFRMFRSRRSPRRCAPGYTPSSSIRFRPRPAIRWGCTPRSGKS
jgi:hypothetical protein